MPILEVETGPFEHEKTKGLNLQLVCTYCLQNGYTILCFWTLVLRTHDVKLGRTNVLGVAGQFGGQGTLLLLKTLHYF